VDLPDKKQSSLLEADVRVEESATFCNYDESYARRFLDKK